MSIFKKNKLQRSHPGPQKKIFRINIIFLSLCFLTLVFLALTTYAAIQLNGDFPKSYKGVFSFKLLDIKTACSLFVTLVSLLLVRHHFVIGFRPIIVYDSIKAEAFHPYFKDEIVWRVNICNVGLGAALSSQMSFRLNLGQVDESKYDLDFEQLKTELKSSGLVFEKDYFLMTFSSAFVLPAKDTRFVFEIKIPKAVTIAQLDLKIKFRGFLGGSYEKEIFMIPRRGIPYDAETDQSPDLERASDT